MKEEPFNWELYSQNPDKYQVFTRSGLKIVSITSVLDGSVYPLVTRLHKYDDSLITHTLEGHWGSEHDEDGLDLVTMRSEEPTEIAPVEPLTLPDNVEDAAVLIFKVYNPDTKKHELKCASYKTQERALQVSKSDVTKGVMNYETVAIMPISSLPGVLEVLNQNL